MPTIDKDAILEAIDLDSLVTHLRSGMSDWPGIDDEAVEEVVRWATDKHREFSRHVELVDDPYELPNSLARAYMSWLSGWYALNVQNNYTLMRGRTCDPRDQWRSMALCHLAACAGDLLDEQQLKPLHDLVTQPMAS
jgi:hypothetical protein